MAKRSQFNMAMTPATLRQLDDLSMLLNKSRSAVLVEAIGQLHASIPKAKRTALDRIRNAVAQINRAEEQ